MGGGLWNLIPLGQVLWFPYGNLKISKGEARSSRDISKGEAKFCG
jgi:hypothetical protein